MLATTSTATQPATDDPQLAPAPAAGKQTPSSQLDGTAAAPPTANTNAPATGFPPALAAHAGETFVDGGHYVWRVDGAGTFTCIAQPPGIDKSSVGAVVKQTKSPDLWKSLCAMAIKSLAPDALPPPSPTPAAPTEPTAPAPSGFSLAGFLAMFVSAGESLVDIGSLVIDLVESIPGAITGPADPAPPAPVASPGTPSTTPAPAPSPTPAPAPSPTPAPEPPVAAPKGPVTPPPSNTPAAPSPEPAPSGTAPPAAVGDVRFCASSDARLRDENGAELAPKKIIPVSTYVRVVERRTSPKVLVRVEHLESENATSGTDLGWTNEANLAALSRPARPSDPSAQMAALHAAASSGHGSATGHCYKAVKGYIKAAGGYGDILDIYADERIQPQFGAKAVDFAAAVQRWGAAALGLEEVGGLPADAPQGTLIVTRGNGQQKNSKGELSLDPVNGDIAVMDRVEGGLVYVINDGVMRVPAKAETWTSGSYAGVLVGMYKPIARK